MYRASSTAIWHSLPGVVCAFQPIAAPNPFAARQNVAHRGARFGVYTAMPGVLPSWSAVTGWTADGSTQYINTGIIIANTTWTVMIRFSGHTVDDKKIFGCYGPGATSRCYYTPRHSSTNSHQHLNGTGSSFLRVTPKLSAGIVATAGKTGYLNGVSEGTLAAGTFDTALPEMYLCGANENGTATFAPGVVPAFLVVARTLSPAEVWLASRQMAYCEQNPDWNAWARRRRYYYAPEATAAATFQAAWARGSNTLLGGGFQ